MARKPKPWYRKDRRSWYVTIDGKRHDLGSTKKAAHETYHQLMAEPRKRVVRGESVAAIVDSFLGWCHNHRAPDTYEWYRYPFDRVRLAIMDEDVPLTIGIVGDEVAGKRVECGVATIGAERGRPRTVISFRAVGIYTHPLDRRNGAYQRCLLPAQLLDLGDGNTPPIEIAGIRSTACPDNRLHPLFVSRLPPILRWSRPCSIASRALSKRRC